MELLYGLNRKQTCPVRINEDVSPREMGIYHHISAALLRFIQGAHAVIDWRGMLLVQYGTPAQGRQQCPTTVFFTKLYCKFTIIHKIRSDFRHNTFTWKVNALHFKRVVRKILKIICEFINNRFYLKYYQGRHSRYRKWNITYKVNIHNIFTAR